MQNPTWIKHHVCVAIDKLEHFLGCAFVLLLVYAICSKSRHGAAQQYRLLLAVTAALAVGVAKEVGDFLEVGALVATGHA